MSRSFAFGCVAILSGLLGYAQAAQVSRKPLAAVASDTPSAPAKYRAVLDKYCVTCHNDGARRANLSLEKLDLTTAGDHPELWEKVIRKLRAGVMPPPGMPRPALDEYGGLRDWLENEMDRKAAVRGVNPGSVVLHRLNRTEYANEIHDLLNLEIDPAAYLPSDDAARGFDNVAGSLTISPTLLEAYTTAATRIARMAVGYWKSPTLANYIAPGDTSQNEHIEGLPLNTRGGLLITHNFPSDGEYKFEVQNFGLGKYTPGEKIEFLIDGERVELFDYVGVGLSQGMQADADGSIAITVPVKAGSHKVGVTFLATNYRPTLDLIKQYERKSLENNSIPQLQYYPAIGLLRIQGPFLATRPDDSRSMRKVLTCHPSSAAQEEP